MSFRKPQVFLRNGPGGYVNGIWVDGIEAPFTAMASVQPVSSKDIATLPEGKRWSDYVKVYTAAQLQVLGEAEGLMPDRLEWLGHMYECIAVEPNQMGVISHWKYMFSKLSQQ